jgi:hypothetical protein
MANSLRITACAYLRCKNDSYSSPLTDDPNYESPVPRVYWCGKTLKAYGPDDELVGLEACQNGRSCHSEIVHVSSEPA